MEETATRGGRSDMKRRRKASATSLSHIVKCQQAAKIPEMELCANLVEEITNARRHQPPTKTRRTVPAKSDGEVGPPLAAVTTWGVPRWRKSCLCDSKPTPCREMNHRTRSNSHSRKLSTPRVGMRSVDEPPSSHEASRGRRTPTQHWKRPSPVGTHVCRVSGCSAFCATWPVIRARAQHPPAHTIIARLSLLARLQYRGVYLQQITDVTMLSCLPWRHGRQLASFVGEDGACALK